MGSLQCEITRNFRLKDRAAAQSPRNVILAAAFPDLELPRCVDAALAGIEPQHHFTQAQYIPSA